MQQFKTFKTIFLIIGIVMVISGCATSAHNISDAETGIKAIAVPEGICLTFDTIPQETSRLFIIISIWGENEQVDSTHDIIGSSANITGTVLEQVKQTKKIVFPFVKPGQIYHISAHFENEETIDYAPVWMNTECTALAGIYFNEVPKLELNKTRTGVTLSSEPEFTAEVQYAPNKYGYSVTIDVSENGSIGYSDKGTGLHWDFEPQMTRGLIEGDYLKTGYYSAYVTAYRNINYDNVTWSVEVAKTPEFIYTVN
jgi:hypothetical protein